MRTILRLAAILPLVAALGSGCAGTSPAAREGPPAASALAPGTPAGTAAEGTDAEDRGTLVGDVSGVLAGGAIGRYRDEPTKDREQTVREQGEAPPQGILLHLESVRANPAALAPGDTIQINLTYAVVTPGEGHRVRVRETREISYEGAVVGRATIERSRGSGTWRSTVPVSIAGRAAFGNYRIVASVEAGDSVRDVGEAFFKVRD